MQKSHSNDDDASNNMQCDLNVDHTALIFRTKEVVNHQKMEYLKVLNVIKFVKQKYLKVLKEDDSHEGYTYHDNEINFDKVQFRKTFGLEDSNICDEDKISQLSHPHATIACLPHNQISQLQVTSIKDSQNRINIDPTRMNADGSDLATKLKQPQSSSTQNKSMITSPAGTGNTTISGHVYTT